MAVGSQRRSATPLESFELFSKTLEQCLSIRTITTGFPPDQRLVGILVRDLRGVRDALPRLRATIADHRDTIDGLLIYKLGICQVRDLKHSPTAFEAIAEVAGIVRIAVEIALAGAESPSFGEAVLSRWLNIRDELARQFDHFDEHWASKVRNRFRQEHAELLNARAPWSLTETSRPTGRPLADETRRIGELVDKLKQDKGKAHLTWKELAAICKHELPDIENLQKSSNPADFVRKTYSRHLKRDEYGRN